VSVDHAPIQRWVVKYSPPLEDALHRRKRLAWVSWRMDEICMRVQGQWYYLDRAVDKTGQTIDCLLTQHRDERAAKRFLTKALRRHGVPETITIDGSAAHEAAIKSYNEEHGTAIVIRQVQYLNNVVEQGLTVAEQFYALAAYPPPGREHLPKASTDEDLRQNCHVPGAGTPRRMKMEPAWRKFTRQPDHLPCASEGQEPHAMASFFHRDDGALLQVLGRDRKHAFQACNDMVTAGIQEAKHHRTDRARL
jgi:DDE domain